MNILHPKILRNDDIAIDTVLGNYINYYSIMTFHINPKDKILTVYVSISAVDEIIASIFKIVINKKFEYFYIVNISNMKI